VVFVAAVTYLPQLVFDATSTYGFLPSHHQRNAISNVRLGICEADLVKHSHLYDNGEHPADWRTFWETLPSFDIIVRSILQDLPGVTTVIFEDWTVEGLIMKMVKGTEWEHLVRRERRSTESR
jgi:hypothetical protein